MYIGIDIGGTAIKIGLVDKNANIIQKERYDIDYNSKDFSLLDIARKSTLDFIKLNNININEVLGIGVSATGQISNEGIVIGTAGHIPNWQNSDIKSTFEKEFKVPTKVINDANSMIIAEKKFGVAKGYSHVVGITIGTGVGGGIIVEDKLLTGFRGLAGEIGHILINKCDILDSYNREGSLEDAGSTKVLVKYIEELGYKNINGKHIFDNLMHKAEVKEKYEIWLDDICRGLVSLIHIFNPEIVVIGGGISEREEFILELRDKTMKSVMTEFTKGLQFRAAILGNDAGLLGAVAEFL